MNEELLSVLQEILDKQEKLLDTQSAISSGARAVIGAVIVAIATVVGVYLTARAEEKRQRNELNHGSGGMGTAKSSKRQFGCCSPSKYGSLEDSVRVIGSPIWEMPVK